MSSSSRICADENILIRLLGSDQHPEILELWERWMESGSLVVAPSLLKYELVNSVYQAVKHKMLDDSAARTVIESLFDLPITYVDDEHLHVSALEISVRFGIRAAYDAHYVALAQHLGAELWTAGKRLYNAVHHQLDFVHIIE